MGPKCPDPSVPRHFGPGTEGSGHFGLTFLVRSVLGPKYPGSEAVAVLGKNIWGQGVLAPHHLGGNNG